MKANLDFICGAFGLIEVAGGRAAVGVQEVVEILKLDGEGFRLRTRYGATIDLTDDDMVELEHKIKARSAAAQLALKESYKADLKARVDAQNEISGEVAPAGVIINAQPGKRWAS